MLLCVVQLRHVMAARASAGSSTRTIKTASERLTRSTEMKETRFFALRKSKQVRAMMRTKSKKTPNRDDQQQQPAYSDDNNK